MKRIKIHFHLNTMMYGGLEKVMFTYLKHIDRKNYDVSLSIGRCMYDLELLKNDLPEDISISYLIDEFWINCTQYKKNNGSRLSKIERLLHNVFLKPYSQYLYKTRLKKITKNVDVVIDFDFYSEDVCTHAPIISVLHFSLISLLNWEINPSSRQYRRIKDKFAKHDKIILLNHDTLQECIEVFPEFRDKYNVIYNPFDLSRIHRLSLEAFDNLYGDYIVSVCRLDESQKDVTTLIKAFNVLVNKYKYNGNLVLVGDGNSRALLEELVIGFNLQNQVFFVGIQQNPFNFMSNAKLFVLSSKFEGLPSVVIEALILGVPTVAADCPTGAKEILQNGEYGKLFEVGDYIGLAAILSDLLNSPELCQKFINNAAVRANDFDISSALNKLYRLIDSVLKR